MPLPRYYSHPRPPRRSRTFTLPKGPKVLTLLSPKGHGSLTRPSQPSGGQVEKLGRSIGGGSLARSALRAAPARHAQRAAQARRRRRKFCTHIHLSARCSAIPIRTLSEAAARERCARSLRDSAAREARCAGGFAAYRFALGCDTLSATAAACSAAVIFFMSRSRCFFCSHSWHAEQK